MTTPYWSDFVPNSTFYRILSGFHRTFATGVACRQGTQHSFWQTPSTYKSMMYCLLIFQMLRIVCVRYILLSLRLKTHRRKVLLLPSYICSYRSRAGEGMGSASQFSLRQIWRFQFQYHKLSVLEKQYCKHGYFVGENFDTMLIRPFMWGNFHKPYPISLIH